MLRLEEHPPRSSRQPQDGLSRAHAPRVDGQVRVDDFDRFLFVVGAPRCGTTTLFHLLKSNDSVASPFVKEPHFFAQHDLRDVPETDLRNRIERDYLRRFFDSDPARRIGLDASVTYLYAPEQLEPVLRIWPQSRFIVSLRDPLTMLPSLHKRLIYNGDESIGSFAEAWGAVPERRRGRRVPRNCAEASWLLYDEPCRYFTYLQRLFSAVGRERCLVLLFDDLVADPTRHHARLMEFAGLPAPPGVEVAAHRPTYEVRLRWLQRLLKRPPKALREKIAGDKFWRRFRDLDTGDARRTSEAILSLRKRLLDWNQIARPPEPMPAKIRDEIRRRFEAEVDGLGKLLGRDLSHWLRPEGMADRVVG